MSAGAPAPVHVVWGGADRFFRPAIGRRIAEVSGGSYREVPSAKTYLALDASDAVAATVRAAAGQSNPPATAE